jgi:hypothetical protein
MERTHADCAIVSHALTRSTVWLQTSPHPQKLVGTRAPRRSIAVTRVQRGGKEQACAARRKRNYSLRRRRTLALTARFLSRKLTNSELGFIAMSSTRAISAL